MAQEKSVRDGTSAFKDRLVDHCVCQNTVAVTDTAGICNLCKVACPKLGMEV